MKHVLLALLFPTMLTAQTTQQLTEQLGKTVLYGDVALSPDGAHVAWVRSEEHTSELQSRFDLVCRLLLEKKKPARKNAPLALLELKTPSLNTFQFRRAE